MYGEKSKLTKGVIGYDPNALYLYCSGNVMPCDKDMLVANEKPLDQEWIIFLGRFKRECFWVCAG